MKQPRGITGEGGAMIAAREKVDNKRQLARARDFLPSISTGKGGEIIVARETKDRRRQLARASYFQPSHPATTWDHWYRTR